VDDPGRRAEMGRAARAFAERSIPSWQDVLREDLVPFWQRAAAPEHERAAAPENQRAAAPENG
jgi:hypothetical protein